LVKYRGTVVDRDCLLPLTLPGSDWPGDPVEPARHPTASVLTMESVLVHGPWRATFAALSAKVTLTTPLVSDRPVTPVATQSAAPHATTARIKAVSYRYFVIFKLISLHCIKA
jgi:hypothetical protein